MTDCILEGSNLEGPIQGHHILIDSISGEFILEELHSWAPEEILKVSILKKGII